MAGKRIARLTQLAVDKAKPRGRRYDLPDGPGGIGGLALRVSERGVKSYSMRYRIHGKQLRLSLGTHPVMTLVKARQAAREALQQVEWGIDPAAAKTKEKAERERNTVEVLIARYVERHLQRNTKRPDAGEQMLRRELRPWMDRPAKSIGRRDVLDLVDAISDRGSPISANRTLSLVKRLFNWLVERGVVESNPAAGIKPPHKEKPRERSLNEAEVRAVWRAFETMGYPLGDIGRLLLLTGQRRGEIAGLRWADLDLETGVLCLAGMATKTGFEHVLPLSGAAVEILRNLPRVSDSPLLFPASRLSSANTVSGFSKALLTAHRLSGVSGWHFHDLRRTTATHMARLNVAPHVVEKILNHTAGSTLSLIARTYNRHSYQAEMRAALELWASEVERIVAGEAPKVVPLHGRSA